MSGGLPSASVVIAARNAEATIKGCLDSILALRYPRDRLEVIVVDNGSRDRTRAIVERYGSTLSLLHESRPGSAAARNTGIRHARGDVIALTDADCTADPGWLAALVDPLADPTVGLVGGSILARRPASPIELYGEVIHDQRRAIEHFRPPYVATGNWAARRVVIEALGLFDETLPRGSDSEYAFRAGRAGYRLVFAPDAVVYHRNERTLRGLMREGFQHTYHGTEVGRRYSVYIATQQPLEASEAVLPASRPYPRRAAIAFHLGRRLGRLAGRARGLRLASPPA